MYRIPVLTIRLFDRKELLRLISEGNFPDQTGVEELSSTQIRSAIADSGRCRSAFRDDADHYSVLIPIRIPL
jgi:hypothetical protein